MRTELENTSDIDKDLVTRIINDDEMAFSELYLKYRNSIIYYSIQFLKSKAAAEDILHDAFASIWKTRRFLDPDKSFSSYLFTIVHNRILNQLRNITKEEKLHEYISSKAIDYRNDPYSKFVQNEMQEMLDNCIEKLPRKQREVFKMSREQDMSHKQIALALGMSERNVNAYISQSIKSIRRYLMKYYL